MAGAAHVAMRESPPNRVVPKTNILVIIGRLLVGYAVGTITGVAPVFGAEIAKVSLHSPHQERTCVDRSLRRLKREPESQGQIN